MTSSGTITEQHPTAAKGTDMPTTPDNEQIMALITIGACAVGEWLHEEGIMGNPAIGMHPTYDRDKALALIDRLATLRKMTLETIDQNVVDIAADWLSALTRGEITPDNLG
jgi:hypothetical protein